MVRLRSSINWIQKISLFVRLDAWIFLGGSHEAARLLTDAKVQQKLQGPGFLAVMDRKMFKTQGMH
jgi:hypothetical protein